MKIKLIDLKRFTIHDSRFTLKVCLIIVITALHLTQISYSDTNFQNIDWTQFLGGKFGFVIKNVGMPDLMYPRRYNANEKEDDIVLMYRGSGVDMRMYVWDQKVYRMYFSMEHKFNIFHGVRSGMSKEQIESLLGPVGKVTDKNLHLWKSGNVKLVVDFDKDGKAKEILLSLDEN